MTGCPKKRVPQPAQLDGDVDRALNEMRRSLELTEQERRRAAYYQDMVRRVLTEESLGGVDTSFLIGSYARQTAITPLKDIDIAVVLDRRKRADLLRKGPAWCIHAATVAVSDGLTRLSQNPIEQRCSVGINFLRDAAKIEIVPAFATEDPAIFEIADRHREQWILTAPREHSHLSTVYNERSGGYLKRVIKMLKAWKREFKIPTSSFHIEVMCYKALPGPPRSLSQAICWTLAHLANAIELPCLDPARVGPPIDSNLTDANRRLVAEALVEAARLAKDALRYEEERRTVWANNRWKRIFGRPYPCEDRG